MTPQEAFGRATAPHGGDLGFIGVFDHPHCHFLPLTSVYLSTSSLGMMHVYSQQQAPGFSLYLVPGGSQAVFSPYTSTLNLSSVAWTACSALPSLGAVSQGSTAPPTPLILGPC